MIPSQLTLRIPGMNCMNCVGSVKRALEKVPGVVSADVMLNPKQAVVTFDGAAVQEQALVAAVDAAGFDAEVA